MAVFMFCSVHGAFDIEKGVDETCDECTQKVARRGFQAALAVSSTPTGEYHFKRGSTPKMKGVGDGRSAREFERDHDAWDKENYRDIQREKTEKRNFRRIGSVSAEEYIALQRETGDKHIWREPTKALKRIGKYVKP